MENELTERQKRNREAKEAARVPNAVTVLHALLKDFTADDRKRVIRSVEVLLEVPDGK